MPNIDSVPHTPEEAIAKGRCPECGRDLSISSAFVEKMLHWPNGAPEPNSQPNGQQHRDEILYRMKLIDDYFAAHPSLFSPTRLGA